MNMPTHHIPQPPTGLEEIDLADLPTPLTTSQIAHIAAIIDRQRDSVSERDEMQEVLATRNLFAAHRMLQIMRMGNHAFGGLLNNPAWEILLDLFVHHVEGTRTSIMSLCIASDTPASTMLRYLNALTDAGLVIRVPSNDDRPSPMIALSDNAFTEMKTILS